ncbi:MAG: RsbRD N-terminal domain-containing protein [Acidobacteriota bacterium]
MKILAEFLASKRDGIIGLWLERTLQNYPDGTSRFMLQEHDRFRNPVGNALKENLPALFDALLEIEATGEFEHGLDTVIRMRAVQDFSPSEAVSFIFLLKEIVRQELKGGRQIDSDGSAFAAFETRVDKMALHAFDLYVRCREQISEIKADEIRRRFYVRETIAKNCADETKDKKR